MSLPPRLPMPEFLPDPSDIPRLRSDARRRRATQGGTAGALIAVALLFTSVNGSPNGLQRLEPVTTQTPTTPRPSASATPPGEGASPDPSGSPAGDPDATPPATPGPGNQPSPSPSPRARVRTTYAASAEVVADPGGTCQDTHTVTTTSGTYQACHRLTWPAKTRVAQGGDLVHDYCVRLGTAVGAFSAPHATVYEPDGPYWTFEHDSVPREELEVRAGSCVRWTVRWDGTAGDPDNAVVLTPGRYSVVMMGMVPAVGSPVVSTDDDGVIATSSFRNGSLRVG